MPCTFSGERSLDHLIKYLLVLINPELHEQHIWLPVQIGYLSNGPSKKERGQVQRMQKGADCDIV